MSNNTQHITYSAIDYEYSVALECYVIYGQRTDHSNVYDVLDTAITEKEAQTKVNQQKEVHNL